MTLLGHKQYDQDFQRKVARLIQLHEETNPVRLGIKFNLHPKHLRRIWTQTALSEMARLDEALRLIR